MGQSRRDDRDRRVADRVGRLLFLCDGGRLVRVGFGSLAAVLVVMAYLYLSTTVFLFGAQLDAIIRAQATGTLSGVDHEA